VGAELQRGGMMQGLLTRYGWLCMWVCGWVAAKMCVRVSVAGVACVREMGGEVCVRVRTGK